MILECLGKICPTCKILSGLALESSEAQPFPCCSHISQQLFPMFPAHTFIFAIFGCHMILDYKWVLFNPNMDNQNSWFVQSPVEITCRFPCVNLPTQSEICLNPKILTWCFFFKLSGEVLVFGQFLLPHDFGLSWKKAQLAKFLALRRTQ